MVSKLSKPMLGAVCKTMMRGAQRHDLGVIFPTPDSGHIPSVMDLAFRRAEPFVAAYQTAKLCDSVEIGAIPFCHRFASSTSNRTNPINPPSTARARIPMTRAAM